MCQAICATSCKKKNCADRKLEKKSVTSPSGSDLQWGMLCLFKILNLSLNADRVTLNEFSFTVIIRLHDTY